MTTLQQHFVLMIAQKLGETEIAPIEQIRRICLCMEPEQVVALVKRAKTLHATNDISNATHRNSDGQKRTVGGVFFRLCFVKKSGGLTTKQRRYCFSQHFKLFDAAYACAHAAK